MPAIPDTGLVASLDDLKAHLNITSSSTAQDDELTHVLIAASELVSRIIGGPLAVTTVTERYSTMDSVIVVSQRPLVSVTSITPDVGSAVPSSWYDVDSYGGVVANRYRTWGSGTIVYQAGLSQVPERIRLAGLIIAKHLWETQYGSGAGGFNNADTDGWTPTMGYAIPRRATELLALDPPLMIA